MCADSKKKEQEARQSRETSAVALHVVVVRLVLVTIHIGHSLPNSIIPVPNRLNITDLSIDTHGESGRLLDASSPGNRG